MEGTWSCEAARALVMLLVTPLALVWLSRAMVECSAVPLGGMPAGSSVLADTSLIDEPGDIARLLPPPEESRQQEKAPALEERHHAGDIIRLMDGRFLDDLAAQCPAVGRPELERIIATAWKVSREEHYDFLALLAQIKAESDFNPRLVSRAGAVGLMQLLPETARWLGVGNPFDIEENIRGGIRYMRFLSRYTDSPALSAWERYVARLACYNSGPGTYLAALRIVRRKRLPPVWRYVSRYYHRASCPSAAWETKTYIKRNREALALMRKRLFPVLGRLPAYPAPPGRRGSPRRDG